MAMIDLVANTATVLTILSFLTGISICRNIHRVGSTSEFSSLPFLVGILCGYLWLRYGLILDDYMIISINTVGLTFQSFYLLWFYHYTVQKRPLARKIFMLVSFLFLVHLYIQMATDPHNLIGLLACLSSLFFCAAPLPIVSDVIKTGCTEKLPFPMILSSFMVSFMWFLYGYLIGDPFIQTPNAIGAAISGVQLSLFLIYPSKRHMEKKYAKLREHAPVTAITDNI